MALIKKIRDKIQDIFSGNTKLLFIVLAGLLLIIILCIILAVHQCSLASSKGKMEKGNETFLPSDDFIFTDDNSLTQDYYYSRDSKEKWSQEDLDEWFTPLDSDFVKTLSKNNDFIINDLMGAAP